MILCKAELCGQEDILAFLGIALEPTKLSINGPTRSLGQGTISQGEPQSRHTCLQYPSGANLRYMLRQEPRSGQSVIGLAII